MRQGYTVCFLKDLRSFQNLAVIVIASKCTLSAMDVARCEWGEGDEGRDLLSAQHIMEGGGGRG